MSNVEHKGLNTFCTETVDCGEVGFSIQLNSSTVSSSTAENLTCPTWKLDTKYLLFRNVFYFSLLPHLLRRTVFPTT